MSHLSNKLKARTKLNGSGWLRARWDRKEASASLKKTQCLAGEGHCLSLLALAALEAPVLPKEAPGWVEKSQENHHEM